MKRIATIIAVGVGVAAGAWTGLRSVRSSGSASTGSTASASATYPTAPESTPLAAAAFSSIPGDNPIAQKIFSALRDPLELRRNARIQEAVQALRAEEFPGLIAAVEKLPLEFQFVLLNTLLERWASVDAAALKSWILGGSINGHWACRTWAKVDPKGAIAAAFDPAFGDLAESLIDAVASNLALEDIPAFWSRLKDLPSAARARMMRKALDRFGALSPAQTLAMAADLPDPAERLEYKAAALGKWARENPREAMGRFREMLPDLDVGLLGNRWVSDFASSIAGKDGKLAMEFVGTLPPEFRTAAGIAVASVSAAKDPAGALDWCLANGVEPTRGKRTEFGGWSASVIGEAISKQPEKTFAWISALPEGAQRDQFMERALEESLGLSSKGKRFGGDFPVVDRLFAELPPEAQERVSAKMGKSWGAEASKPDLAEWAKSLDEGPIRQNVISGALHGAFDKDAALAERMLATLTAPVDRDAALQGLCSGMKNERPALAVSRALEIASQDARKQTLDDIVVPWLKREPTRSREWLEKEGGSLPGDWKSEWLTRGSSTESKIEPN